MLTHNSTLDRWLGFGVLAVLLAAAGLLLLRKPPTPKLIHVALPAATAPVLYRELAPIPTGMLDARGIAVAQGHLYVVNATTLKEFTLKATAPSLARRVIPLSYPISPIYCVSVSPSGVIYLGGDGGIGLVVGQGRSMLMTVWPHDQDAKITSLAAGNHLIWAADATKCIVIGYNTSGKALRTLTGFTVPSGHLDVAGDDNGVVVSNPGGASRVLTFARDGRLLRQWGEPGLDNGHFSGCCNPAHLARLPDGGVVTSDKGVPRVQVFDAAGRPRGLVADPKTFAGNAAGLDIATDAAGRVYLLDTAKRQVRIFAKR